MLANGSRATRCVGDDRLVQNRLTPSDKGVDGCRHRVGPVGGTAGCHQSEENA